MIVETKNLTGAALDWAVLEAVKPGLEHPERAGITTFGPLFGSGYKYPRWGGRKYNPSTNWLQGGPIIERERISISTEENGWSANICAPRYGLSLGFGPTPLIAAMRCYVASKLGDTVDIPEELL